jgi:hypothetical protein
MDNEKYYVIRCYRDFNGFYKLCKQLKCPYYKKKHMNSYGTYNYREAWLTPAEFTFLKLLNNNPHITEYMVRAYGPPKMYSINVDDNFIETYGSVL